MDYRAPIGMPTERIVDLFTYRCRAQLFELTTQVLQRHWEAAATGQAEAVERMRTEERQLLRRHYQRWLREDLGLSAATKARVLRWFLDLAGVASLVYVATLWAQK